MHLVPQNLIQSGLENPDDRPLFAVGRLADQLLGLVSDLAGDDESPAVVTFRARLCYYRDRISDFEPDESLTLLAEECLNLCENHFNNARSAEEERNNALGVLIDFLRHSMTELASHSTDFNKVLATSSERFGRLDKIDDIRELKLQMAQEVGDLKRIIAERQRRDEAAYERLSRRIEGLRIKLDQA
jgi:hypothetical protein